ncbi:MAG: MaoC family dehydratase [Bacteroidetes bacterium]|jgi:acyl dehydratase|nr:MaoC family dehydratase [Bacteroidota bacterium]MDF1863640.1 MaoC family dehydratase [Saprospiraceae bacterium]
MTDTPYKTTFDHLTDMQDYVGKEIGLSDWLTIDQESVNSFAKLTKDEQWIHIDVEKSAKYSPYKTTIAHGFFVLSLASHFSYECIAFKDVGMGVNYGLDKVRFTNATPVGAKIRGRISLMEYEPKEGGAKYKLKLVMELEGQEKPACVAEWIGIAYVK